MTLPHLATDTAQDIPTDLRDPVAHSFPSLHCRSCAMSRSTKAEWRQYFGIVVSSDKPFSLGTEVRNETGVLQKYTMYFFRDPLTVCS